MMASHRDSFTASCFAPVLAPFAVSYQCLVEKRKRDFLEHQDS